MTTSDNKKPPRRPAGAAGARKPAAKADAPAPRPNSRPVRKVATGGAPVPATLAKPKAEGEPERIAKRLSRAGVCSRRDAERWIAEGRVVLNGKVLTTPAQTVTPADVIEVDGKPLPDIQPPRLFRLHKAMGLVTTTRDPEGRPTIFDHLPPHLPRLMAVGRLDLNSEGLLLLTNDGALKRFLEHPSTGLNRRYRVRAHGYADAAKLASLAKGVVVDGVRYGPMEAQLDLEQSSGHNLWLTIGIREGKNREVRRVLESIGLRVNRLIRVAYGPIQLGKLERMEVEEVPQRVVRDQFGKAMGL